MPRVLDSNGGGRERRLTFWVVLEGADQVWSMACYLPDQATTGA